MKGPKPDRCCGPGRPCLPWRGAGVPGTAGAEGLRALGPGGDLPRARRLGGSALPLEFLSSVFRARLSQLRACKGAV